MKKYLVALTLLPLSANGALSLFTQIPKLARLIQATGQQKAFLSSSKISALPQVRSLLEEIVVRDLNEQKILLGRLYHNEEYALKWCVNTLIKHVEHYQIYGQVGIYGSWIPREETIQYVAQNLHILR